MSESEDPIYRIICRKDTDYCLASRGGNVVFALTNPCDGYQHWIKDERHGATIKDSEGQPAFALINRATGQAISHCPRTTPVPLVPFNVNACDESVLWTMSMDGIDGFRFIRRVDQISVVWVARDDDLYDGHIIDLYAPTRDYEKPRHLWKIVEVPSSTCISLFRPSQHTVKIICQAKMGYNLAIDKDGSTVLLVPSNPKDKYQFFHWYCKKHSTGSKKRHTVYLSKMREGQEAFALVNKATGKAIKHGFGSKYPVQVALFDRNYMDPSLLWTESGYARNSFRQIRLQNNIVLVFDIFDHDVMNSPLLGLSRTGMDASKQWKIEDFE